MMKGIIDNGSTLTRRNNKMFNVNQIVKGKVAGYFVVLGFRKIDGEDYAQLKSVNPANFAQQAAGELALPITSIEAA